MFRLAFVFVFSALGGTRTPNRLIRSQMLYPIEPRALNLLCTELILAKRLKND